MDWLRETEVGRQLTVLGTEDAKRATSFIGNNLEAQETLEVDREANIDHLFVWEDTPQGGNFWYNLYRECLKTHV